jgi:hypothetical protein
VAWGWDAVTQYADLPAEERAGFYLFESFKKYLIPKEFPGEGTVPIVGDALQKASAPVQPGPG